MLYRNGSEETCSACTSTGGEFVTCDQCSSSYHIDCLQPPLRRVPRGLWTCDSCKNKGKKRKGKFCLVFLPFH